MEGFLQERESDEWLRARLEDSKRRLLTSATQTMAEDASFDTDDLPDEVDAAAAEHSRSLFFRLRTRKTALVRRIEGTLERIAAGSFTVCDRCGQEIPRTRLEAEPLTALCVDCKEEEELEQRRSFGWSRRIA
jgi:DnaK suppressor protein